MLGLKNEGNYTNGSEDVDFSKPGRKPSQQFG